MRNLQNMVKRRKKKQGRNWKYSIKVRFYRSITLLKTMDPETLTSTPMDPPMYGYRTYIVPCRVLYCTDCH